jgi:predicted TPR repeat methyltransferase
VFTCEVGAESDADYVLQRTYRYTHQRSYVQRLLEEAGFKDFSMEDRVLRYEAGEPVQGFLVTACKPAAGKTARRSPKSAKPGPLAK